MDVEKITEELVALVANTPVRSATDVIRILRWMEIEESDTLKLRPAYNNLAPLLDLKNMSPAGWATAVYRVYTQETLEEVISRLEVDTATSSDLTHTLITELRAKHRLQQNNRTLRHLTNSEIMAAAGLTETFSQILEILTETTPHNKLPRIQTTKSVSGKQHSFGVICLTDIHLNELVRDIDATNNTYSMDIAAKRLRMGIDSSIRHLQAAGISNVLLLTLGDIVNSNRRDEEKIHSEASRGVATLVGAFLQKQIIDQLAAHFNVAVAYVTGNESRFDLENGFSAISNTDNFDFLIYHMTKAMYTSATPRVTFLEVSDPKQAYLTIDGFHLLALHGEDAKGRNIERTLSSYTNLGKEVNLLVTGHYHSTQMTDSHFRVGSICGGNAYSAKALHFTTRPSMGLILVNADNSWDGMSISLSDAESYGATYTIPSEYRRWFIGTSQSTGPAPSPQVQYTFKETIDGRSQSK